MKEILRKSMLYKTEVEYGDYTMNHVQGCAHGCLYPCYAYLLAKRFGKIKTYQEWCEPFIVANTLELLDKELPKLRNKIKSVQLCFTTDPFMEGYIEVSDMSLKAIEKINNDGVKCCVLTKGILPKKLIEFSKENEYGITLVSLDEQYRRKMEPGSSMLEARIAALEFLHNEGCKTWISMEPYPTPNIISQNINDILERVSFVDKIIFGRTNYSKVVTEYKDSKLFYKVQALKVIDFCKKHNISYHIKKGTIE